MAILQIGRLLAKAARLQHWLAFGLVGLRSPGLVIQEASELP